MRVLVVEDDPVIQETLEKLLKLEGFVVDVCSDGAEAIEVGLQNDYHAIILDPGLPIFSGEEIIRRWRRAGRKFPIIVVTGTRAAREQMRELIHLGISHYAQKPINDYQVLIDWVRTFCNTTEGVAQGSVVHHGEIELDTRLAVATHKGRRLSISSRELAVLKELILAAGTPMTAKSLAAKCFGDDLGLKEQDVRTYIARLREEVGHEAIVTVGGRRGYALGS